MTREATLHAVHLLRCEAHQGMMVRQVDNWPQTPAEWRQTPHGAPWDANVHMAEWHLKLATKIKEAGLI